MKNEDTRVADVKLTQPTKEDARAELRVHAFQGTYNESRALKFVRDVPPAKSTLRIVVEALSCRG